MYRFLAKDEYRKTARTLSLFLDMIGIIIFFIFF